MSPPAKVSSEDTTYSLSSCAIGTISRALDLAARLFLGHICPKNSHSHAMAALTTTLTVLLPTMG